MMTEIQALKAAIEMWLEVSTDKPNTDLAHNCHLCEFVCKLHNVHPEYSREFGPACEMSCPMQGFWDSIRYKFQCEVIGTYADWMEEQDKETAMFVAENLKSCLEWWEDLREMQL